MSPTTPARCSSPGSSPSCPRRPHLPRRTSDLSPALALLLALALPLGLAACSKRPDEPAARPRPASSTDAAPATSSSSAGLELRWADPPGWKRRPGSNAMRKFEYTIAHAPGDTEDGELVVTSFGQGQGGSIDSNIERWVRQFTPDSKSDAKRDKREAGGYPVELVEVDGTYNAMAMPGGPPPRPKPRYRLLGAIVSTPSTLWFFKLVGPDATVAAARANFHALLDSVR